jgi:hypothetical protein
MAITQNTFTGNGSNLGPFSFTFKWLEPTDIKVTVGGVLKTAGTHYNLQALNYTTKDGGQVLFTAGNAPANNATIRVYRDTDDNALSATFFSGSAIRAQDLNDDFTQNLYVTQEVNNNAVNIDGSNPMVGDLNMGGYKVTNLATPVAGTDAANRSFVEGVFSSEVPVFYRRWSKTAAGGETSFSGNDDNGIALSYVPGSEKVFINGALQIRGVDYLGTTGSTLTGIPALTAGDIIEVHSSSSYTVGTVPDGSVTNAKVDGAAAIQSTKLAFTQAGTGTVTRTVDGKLKDIVSVKDFGAVGDGVADDTAAVTNAKALLDSQQNGVFLAGSGEYATTGTIWTNNVAPTLMPMTRPGVLGVFEGTSSNPDTKDRGPTVWVQKYTKYDSDGDRFNHNVGAVFGEVFVKGTGVAGANDTEGSWIGVLGNSVLNGTNQGTPGAPDYDAFGSTIGVAGFARLTGYPGDGNIACGVWGYAQGPTIDATTQGNLPSTNWSLVGVESNIQINHQDIGEQANVVGKGSSVGFYGFNYRTPNTGKMDWTFGLVLTGNPNDDNYSSTNIDNWNGFYCGLLIDKIKAKGIRFGQYFKTGSYGIYFPDTYVGSQEPAAAIYLGNSKIAMGQYVGSTFNNGDLWHNGGQLYWQHSAQTRRLLTHNQATGVLPTSTKIDFQTNGGFTQFSIGATTSSANYLKVFGAAAAATPSLIAEGSDTNIDIELRPKGTGRVWVGAWTTNADAAVNGYITVKDSTGTLRKIATIA